MKKTLKNLSLFLLPVIILAACNQSLWLDSDETDYYWYGEEKVPVQKIDGKFYIEF